MAVLLLAGCVGNESYPNNPRPPAVLTVSVFLGEDQIAISPKPFGAGPARFIIANHTGADQTVLLSNDQFDREVSVADGQTVNVKQTVQPGPLSLSTSDSAADSVVIDVTAKRPSAQHDLNQP